MKPAIRFTFSGLLFLALVPSPSVLAQNQPAADSVSSDQLLFYTFANDAFFRTDYYFTQGMTLNVVLPGFSKLPVNKILLPGPTGSVRHYGVKLHYDGFTPLRIQDDTIRRGDRPYASYIYATLYRTATSSAAKRRLTSGLNIGFIGPAAGAKGFQTKVHELIDAPTPRGWNYQIGNDVVLGYEATLEQQLLGVGRAVEVIGRGQALLGTLNTSAGGGLLVRVGTMAPYFQNLGLASRANRAGLTTFQLYATGLAEGRVVGYNATLQGGLFNRNSPYTLPASDIKRVVGQGTVSVVAAYAGLSFRTSAVWITPEFRGSRHHAWVQFGLGAAF